MRRSRQPKPNRAVRASPDGCDPGGSRTSQFVARAGLSSSFGCAGFLPPLHELLQQLGLLGRRGLAGRCEEGLKLRERGLRSVVCFRGLRRRVFRRSYDVGRGWTGVRLPCGWRHDDEQQRHNDDNAGGCGETSRGVEQRRSRGRLPRERGSLVNPSCVAGVPQGVGNGVLQLRIPRGGRGGSGPGRLGSGFLRKG
jgi:hypothetical protein